VQQSVVGAARWLLVLGVLGLTACSAAGAGGQDTGDEGSATAGTTGGNTGATGTTGTGSGTGTTSGTGSSSGSGSGSGSGGGGGPTVTFNWPETLPGEKCLPGKYAGTFDGIYMSSLTFFPAPIPVSGNVNITLGQSMDGEFFEITDGKLDGVADFAFPFAGNIVGGLNCTTKKFTADIKMGFYTVAGIGMVGFEGPMPADYDKVAHSFVLGEWHVLEVNPTFGGNGTWTATWVGP
jgi:hypothetical protein